MHSSLFSPQIKKKYLFIDGPLGGGGAERVLIDILRNFDYSQYSVDLCLLCPGGPLEKEIPEQVNVIHLWPSYTLSFRLANHLSKDLGINCLLKKKLRDKLEDKYDVVISFLEGMPLKLHALSGLHGRHFSWVHCDLFKFPYEAAQFRKGEELKMYEQMDAVICVANNTETSFHKRFPGLQTTTRVIYNPIDFEKICQMADEENIINKLFTVVVIGRLTSPKKIDRVVRLAARLKEEKILDVQFQIIGEGELRHELEEQIQALAVADMVSLLGFKQNPFPYIKAADMLLSSSMAEGFGLVICEAMVLGVPVISTDTDGPREILQNEYGLLCQHDDESIYQAFMQMYTNADLRRSFVDKAKKHVENFRVENTVREIYKL